jgi:hypothetical protein
VKIEIEIPDPPEGWVYEGYRQGLPGELTLRGGVWMRCESQTVFEYPISVKEKPLWEPSPMLVSVLKTGWIARDSPGGWFWYPRKPTFNSRLWLGESKSLNAIKKELLPPDSIPWDQSRFKIGDPKE